MKLTLNPLQDPTKVKFLIDINSHIKSLEIQRKRICDPLSKDIVHDAGYYMICLRRLYRIIEIHASHDSRVANLKGKYSDLYSKIKMRDDFEHDVKTKLSLDKEELIDLGIIEEGFTGNIRIQTSVFKKGNSRVIVSSNITSKSLKIVQSRA